VTSTVFSGNKAYCHVLPLFPPVHIHTVFDFGETITTEQKMLSSGSIFIRRKQKESMNMSSKNNNQLNIPQAREAMDKFKMQAASEVGVNLQSGYNASLTSREACDLGGQMVKKMCPIRTTKYARQSRTATGHM
jgi:small acid-soluble spore protein D (minor alpha/beta-type SASP)